MKCSRQKCPIVRSLILVLLWTKSCASVTVIIDGVKVDCTPNCACCKGGLARCGIRSEGVENACLDGCVDGIYGLRCHNLCPRNCSTCDQINGRTCYTCKDTFYGSDSLCTKSCSVGCYGQSCNMNGTCQCNANFDGHICDTCIQGKHGADCLNDCDYQNCKCTAGSDCDSCKTGFYDKNTFCQTPCSTGCLNDVCNDNGSCPCRSGFTGFSCTECISGYHGVECNMRCPSGCSGGICSRNGTCYTCLSGYHGEQCNNTCSAGCSNKLCTREGICICKEFFIGTFCDQCVAGKYGYDCQQYCSVGCLTSHCARNDGSCECRPNFTGLKCESCKHGQYGLSCDLPCSYTCVEGTCSRSDGTCFSGCVDGYSGYTCETYCDSNCAACQQNDKSYCISCFNNKSGSTCGCPSNCACNGGDDECTACVNNYSYPEYQCKCHTNYCANNCNTCINDTYFVHEGLNRCCQCPSSCKDAMCSSQYKCLHGCEDGLYGYSCSNNCSDTDDMCLICLQDNGACTKCKNGFYPGTGGTCTACSEKCIDNECEGSGGRCIAGCVDGYWGNQCENHCGALCNTCNRSTGDCIDCILTFLYGPSCNLSCSQSCIRSRCDVMGECLNGCNEGYTGIRCEQQVLFSNASGISEGLAAGLSVIGLVVGLAAAMVTMYILKRRRRVTELKAEVHERQTSFGTGPANTDGNNQYEELDKRERVTPHNEAYEMLQTSTNPVDNKQEEDKEKDYELDGGNVYYNER